LFYACKKLVNRNRVFGLSLPNILAKSISYHAFFSPPMA
jgi:hypothetical protein